MINQQNREPKVTKINANKIQRIYREVLVNFMQKNPITIIGEIIAFSSLCRKVFVKLSKLMNSQICDGNTKQAHANTKQLAAVKSTVKK